VGIDSNGWLRLSGGRLLVAVKAMPGARTSAIAGLRNNRLLVRVAAQPEKGKANGELFDCLSRVLGIGKSEIQLVSGATSRLKTLSLPLSCEAELRRLAADTGE
jgi:uncharacterized protein (TIGR00251 family)